MNRFSTTVFVHKTNIRTTSSDEIIKIAIERSSFKRPRLNADNFTDAVIEESEYGYKVKLSYWPGKNGDQI